MMDKSCQSTTITAAATSATTNSGVGNNTSRDQYLRHLNMLSRKISKPIIKKSSTDLANQSQSLNQNHSQSQPASQQPQIQQQAQAQAQAQQQQHHQPPVYNIDKNDFRDVVQKLTGSPVHRRFSTPQPIQAPKLPSSRLHRIRPPPLAHVYNRPAPLLDSGDLRAQQTIINPNIPITGPTSSFGQFGQSITPLSPLPPFPSVHAVAESPVSAHMRYLQNPVSTVDSNPTQFSGFSPLAPLFSPRWNNLIPPPHQGLTPPPSATIASQPQFSMPSSPLPFGCYNSPRSPYPLLSPGLLFSPSPGQLGFPQLPLSPTVQVESPRWKTV